MRGATEAARKVKKVFNALKGSLGKVQRPTPTDAITQLLLGVFSRNQPETKAREMVDRLRSLVVDYNELRVIPVGELADALDSRNPDSWRKCEDVSRALNHIFAIEHAVSLERVKTLPRKDARAYLDRINGLDPYTRARIRLLGFEWHAIPLDEAMWAYCQRESLVDRKAPLDEAQAFLERQVDEADALDFVALLRRQAWSDLAAVIRKGQGPKIESTAPDRKSTNMLQAIAGGAQIEEPELVLVDEVGLEIELDAPRTKKKSAASSKSKPAKSGANSSARTMSTKPSAKPPVTRSASRSSKRTSGRGGKSPALAAPSAPAKKISATSTMNDADDD